MNSEVFPLDFMTMLRQNLEEKHPESSVQSLQFSENTLLCGVVDTVPPSYVQYDRNLSNAKPEEKESIKLLMHNRHTTDKKEEQGHGEASPW